MAEVVVIKPCGHLVSYETDAWILRIHGPVVDCYACKSETIGAGSQSGTAKVVQRWRGLV